MLLVLSGYGPNIGFLITAIDLLLIFFKMRPWRSISVVSFVLWSIESLPYPLIPSLLHSYCWHRIACLGVYVCMSICFLRVCVGLPRGQWIVLYVQVFWPWIGSNFEWRNAIPFSVWPTMERLREVVYCSPSLCVFSETPSLASMSSIVCPSDSLSLYLHYNKLLAKSFLWHCPTLSINRVCPCHASGNGVLQTECPQPPPPKYPKAQ